MTDEAKEGYMSEEGSQLWSSSRQPNSAFDVIVMKLVNRHVDKRGSVRSFPAVSDSFLHLT